MELDKVLFLDVDGVLNYSGCKSRSPSGTLGIEPVKIKLLDKIVCETGCYIVLSSTWRKFPDSVKYLFESLDPKTRCMIIGKTPVLRGEANRGDEIQSWLDSNPGVKNFVIVDDDNDMGALLPYLVLTSYFTGLTEENVNEIILRLNTDYETYSE